MARKNRRGGARAAAKKPSVKGSSKRRRRVDDESDEDSFIADDDDDEEEDDFIVHSEEEEESLQEESEEGDWDSDLEDDESVVGKNKKKKGGKGKKRVGVTKPKEEKAVKRGGRRGVRNKTGRQPVYDVDDSSEEGEMCNFCFDCALSLVSWCDCMLSFLYHACIEEEVVTLSSFAKFTCAYHVHKS